MKFSRFVLAFCCAIIGFINAYAQDVITKNDGSTILSKVISISDSEVSYKSYSNIDGPTYILSKSDINYITYANGSTEYFGSRVAVNNYGGTTYTDAQLLQSYVIKSSEKVKLYNKIAIIGGLTIFGGCTIAGILASTVIDSSIKEWLYVGPLGGLVLGAAWYTTFKVMSNHAKQQDNIAASPLLEQDIITTGNSRLTASMDVLSDLQLNSKALGIGLRFNF
jgi:hypothetical protein